MTVKERIKKAIQYASGQLGPPLSCEYEGDARCTYPERLGLIIEQLESVLRDIG